MELNPLSLSEDLYLKKNHLSVHGVQLGLVLGPHFRKKDNRPNYIAYSLHFSNLLITFSLKGDSKVFICDV